MDGSMLGSLYTLLIASVTAGLVSQHAAVWAFVLLLEGREYIALRNYIPDGTSRMRVLVCSLQTVCCRGMCHIFVCRHCPPLRIAVSNTMILTVRPA